MNCNLIIFIKIVETNSGKLAVWVHLCSRYQSIAQLTWGNNMWLAKQQQEGRENPCTGGKCQSYQNAVFCKMHPLVDFFSFFVIISAQFHFAHQYVTVLSDTVVWRVWKKILPWPGGLFFILHIFYWFRFFSSWLNVWFYLTSFGSHYK